ncbi:MAG: NmrA family NAD(P)-binding protein [Microbacterium sp.]|uniref:NmrA family NAD(P)-binding protein n=1 Tax=Microbacterium sp. TaxID=51671 RepID=UPI003F9DCB60
MQEKKIYAVAGVTGHVGSATADHLLAAGESVRALARTASAAEEWKARGADARFVDLVDATALRSAITECAGLFILLPFALSTDDPDAHADALTSSIVTAVAAANVPHVVMLSSGGADRADGTGPITGLHRLEEALRETGTRLTAMRPGHFQEKVSDAIDAAQHEGIYPVFASSANVSHPLIATQDLGAVAAKLLRELPEQHQSIDVLGPEYTEREVASLLGRKLGRELQVIVLPEEKWAATLVDAGLPPSAATQLAELYRADEDGLLAPRGDRIIRTDTPIEETIDRVLASIVDG